MKLQTLAAALSAVAALSFAGQALAADTVVAKLQSPVAEKSKIVAGVSVFFCEADACSGRAAAAQTYELSACKTIVKGVGPVTSFGGAKKQLDADKLAACNAVAK